MTYSDYEWYLEQDLSEYTGKWVAIIDKHVVGSGKDVSQILEETKKTYPNKKPLITKVKNRLSIL